MHERDTAMATRSTYHPSGFAEAARRVDQPAECADAVADTEDGGRGGRRALKALELGHINLATHCDQHLQATTRGLRARDALACNPWYVYIIFCTRTAARKYVVQREDLQVIRLEELAVADP